MGTLGGSSSTPDRGVEEVAVEGSQWGSFIGPRQGMGSLPYLVIRRYGVRAPDTPVSCIGLGLPMEP